MKRIKLLKSVGLVVAAMAISLHPFDVVHALGLERIINQGQSAYIPGDTCGISGTGLPLNAAIPADLVAGVEANKSAYESAGAATDLPWQALAAIHYRESNLRANADMQAGNPYGGPYRQESTTYAKYGYPANLSQSAEFAGRELQDKAMAGLFNKKITASAVDPELLKDAFFGYNGRAAVYKQQAAELGFDPATQPYEGSPYVMSLYDAVHTDMGIITTDHGSMDGIDKRYGAFTLYVLLGGPTSAVSGGGGDPCLSNAATGSKAKLKEIILLYTWPNYRNPLVNFSASYTRKPEYAARIEEVRGNEYVGGCSGVDCGAYVTRLIRDSGIDPEYNKYQGVTDYQWRYLRDYSQGNSKGNPARYQKLEGVTGTGPLQFGDIAVHGSHTYMFVGDEMRNGNDFKYDSVSASLCTRAPMAGSNAYDFTGYDWFRPLNLGAE